VVAATSGGRAGHTARATATLDLQAGEDPTVVAKRLTMKIYRMIGGDGMTGLHRPLTCAIRRLRRLPSIVVVVAAPWSRIVVAIPTILVLSRRLILRS
jgi:NCAIR mutase (PurE)-related protein